MEEYSSGVAEKKRIISYTAKKRVFVTVVAVVLAIAAICLGELSVAIPFIALPIIIAVAFITDKILILLRPDVYGKDMLKRGRTPVIATCTVAAVFTFICLISGVVSFQLLSYNAKNAATVGTYDDLSEAIDFLQKSGLEDKYNVTVNMFPTSQEEFTVSAIFTAKNGNADLNDFANYDVAVTEGNSVKVTVKGRTIEYGGQVYIYYVLNKDHLGASIVTEDGVIRIVDSDPFKVFGKALGATFGAIIQLLIVAIVYVAGIIAAIVPSEIYFEKLIRAEARKREFSDNGYFTYVDGQSINNN